MSGTEELLLPCHTGDPDLWFAEHPADLERAKNLCGGCPIRRQCLSAALDRAEPWGVWGGEIIDGGVRELIKSLDSLPYADYSDFDLDSYEGRRVLPTYFSRGCINRCCYCCHVKAS
jgi:WhiB family redox-sensing transcriptional regulator